MNFSPLTFFYLFTLISCLSITSTSQSSISTIPGCISFQTIDKITSCYACDSLKNWTFLAPSSCTCKMGYIKQEKTYCRVFCGDGIWTQEQQCDDGNNLSGDGCSAHCYREDYFDCVNVYRKQSVCRYTPYVYSSVYSVARRFGTSQVVIKFKFSPFHPIIMTNDWSQNLLINSQKITYASHEFEDNQILVLNYNINESIQGQTIDWTLSYDQNIFTTSNNTHSIKMSGMNAPLTFEPYYQHQKAIQTISYIIGGVSMAVGVVSMVKAQSNIAFELITTVLFVFYSRIITYHHNPAIFYCLAGLRIAGGFNEFFSDEQREFLEYRIKNRFLIKSELGLMSIMTLSLLGIILALKVMFQLKSFFNLVMSKRIESKNMTQKTQQWRDFMFISRAFRLYFLFQKKFSISFMLIWSYTVLCAFNGFQNGGDRYETYFQPFATNLFQLLFFIVILYYLAFVASILGNFFYQLNDVNPDEKKSKKASINITTHQNISQYIEVYFLYQFITSVFIFFTTDFTKQQRIINHIIQILFCLVLLYLLYLVVFKPYQSLLHMFSIIFQEIVKLFFLGFLFLIEKQVLSPLHVLVGVYITLGLLIILVILSIIRIKKSWIHDSELHENQQRIQAFKKQQNLPNQTVVMSKKKRIRNDQENMYLFENIKKKQEEKRLKEQSLNSAFQKIASSKVQKSRRPTVYSLNQQVMNDFKSEREKFAIFDGFNEKIKGKDQKKQQDVQELQRLKKTMRAKEKRN